MLGKFFSSAPQDQTTPKASDRANPFDLLAAITPGSRKNSTAHPPAQQQQQPPQQQQQGGSRTPTLRPSPSYSGSLSASSAGGFFGSSSSSADPSPPGSSTPVTPGGARAQPTTGTLTVLSTYVRLSGDCRSPRVAARLEHPD
ncbi:hypothetical protein JCM8097_006968 [Rhodosporidiobolus ruineniae]